MRGVFNKCNELEYLDVSNFKASKVKDMGYMFNHCNKLKEIKRINKFYTNQVTNMSSIFNEYKELEYLDLSNFNISNVYDRDFMFCKCFKFNYDPTF